MKKFVEFLDDRKEENINETAFDYNKINDGLYEMQNEMHNQIKLMKSQPDMKDEIKEMKKYIKRVDFMLSEVEFLSYAMYQL
jgi:archaellum component FlaC